MSVVLAPLQTTYLAHLNMNQSCTSLGWEVWSAIHQFWLLKWNNFFPEPATLPSSRKGASANCLHLLERDLPFVDTIALLFLRTPCLFLFPHFLMVSWEAVETIFQTFLWPWIAECTRRCLFSLHLIKKSCLIHKLVIWECHNNKLWLLNLFQKWCQD